MGIINPSPGELYDRLAIVRLKINFCEKKRESKLRMQFENELLQILDVLDRKWNAIAFDGVVSLVDARLDKQIEQFATLETLHAQLWDLESERRRLMSRAMDFTSPDPQNEHYAEIGRNAEKTTLLNDERQKLIAEVNASFSVGDVEKLYALENKAS